MGFRVLRRNYRDSYLSEIDQKGSNGFLVRHTTDDGTAFVMKRSSVVLAVSVPETRATVRWPLVDWVEDATSGHSSAKVVGHTSRSIYFPSQRLETTPHDMVSTRESSDPFCSSPYATSLHSITRPRLIYGYFSDGSEAIRFHYATVPATRLYVPYWGEPPETLPTYHVTGLPACKVEEGQWCGIDRISFKSSGEDILYPDASRYTYAWSYSQEKQHRIGEGIHFPLKLYEFQKHAHHYGETDEYENPVDVFLNDMATQIKAAMPDFGVVITVANPDASLV